MAGLHGHGQRRQAVVVLCLMDGWGEFDAFVLFKQRFTEWYAPGCENLLLELFIPAQGPAMPFFLLNYVLCFPVDFGVSISIFKEVA